MKTFFAGVMLSVGFLALPAPAQEKLSREDALKYAFVTCNNLQEMVGTPIPSDPDVKRPVVVKDGDYGGMLLPEGKLCAETFAKMDKDAKSIGQLWMNKLTFLKDGEVVPGSKLRTVRVNAGGEEHPVTCTTLGARKNGDGVLELVIYGKGAEPLLTVPLRTVSEDAGEMADMSAERTDQGAKLKLTFIGKYEATLPVTDPDRY
jgi:hypothetical protein